MKYCNEMRSNSKRYKKQRGVRHSTHELSRDMKQFEAISGWDCIECWDEYDKVRLDEGRWIWVDDDDDEEDDDEHFTLVGVDGNIFAVMAAVGKFMKQVHCDTDEIKRFQNEVQMQPDYNHALAMCIKYTDMCNEMWREQHQ